MIVVRIAAIGTIILLASCAAPPAPPGPEADRTRMAAPPHPAKRIDHAYVAAVIRTIRALTVYDGPVPAEGNPAVRYGVELLSDGEVIAVRLQESSGYPEFDEAVRRGILRASPLPRRADGVPELRLGIRFYMKQGEWR